MNLVILGGSGSGKSTQAQRICDYFSHIPLISTEGLFQEEIANYSTYDFDSQSYLRGENLVSEKIILEYIQQRLTQSQLQGGWVLEGYPRTVFQAQELDAILHDLRQKLDWAIYLQVPEAVVVERCDLGVAARTPDLSWKDDRTEIIQNRIELFYDRIIPILEYYDRSRRLLTVNGDGSPEVVLHNIVNMLCMPTRLKSP